MRIGCATPSTVGSVEMTDAGTINCCSNKYLRPDRGQYKGRVERTQFGNRQHCRSVQKECKEPVCCSVGCHTMNHYRHRTHNQHASVGLHQPLTLKEPIRLQNGVRPGDLCRRCIITLEMSVCVAVRISLRGSRDGNSTISVCPQPRSLNDSGTNAPGSRCGGDWHGAGKIQQLGLIQASVTGQKDASFLDIC